MSAGRSALVLMTKASKAMEHRDTVMGSTNSSRRSLGVIVSIVKTCEDIVLCKNL